MADRGSPSTHRQTIVERSARPLKTFRSWSCAWVTGMGCSDQTKLWKKNPRRAMCPTQSAMFSAAAATRPGPSAVFSTGASGWSRPAQPARGLDPGVVRAQPPSRGTATSRTAPSRQLRIGPRLTSCTTTCGKKSRRGSTSVECDMQYAAPVLQTLSRATPSPA